MIDEINKYLDNDGRYDDDLPMYDYLCMCLNNLKKIKELTEYVLVDYVFDDDEAIYERFDKIDKLARMNNYDPS